MFWFLQCCPPSSSLYYNPFCSSSHFKPPCKQGSPFTAYGRFGCLPSWVLWRLLTRGVWLMTNAVGLVMCDLWLEDPGEARGWSVTWRFGDFDFMRWYFTAQVLLFKRPSYFSTLSLAVRDTKQKQNANRPEKAGIDQSELFFLKKCTIGFWLLKGQIPMGIMIRKKNIL